MLAVSSTAHRYPVLTNCGHALLEKRHGLVKVNLRLRVDGWREVRLTPLFAHLATLRRREVGSHLNFFLVLWVVRVHV